MIPVPAPHEIAAIYDRIERVPMLGLDLQGWNSNDPVFKELVYRIKPKVVVEVGAWKGASLIHMAELCLSMKLGTLFYAIDVFHGLKGGTMVGSVPLSQIPPNWDRPSMYEQFLFNVKESGFSESVIPVCTLSHSGAGILHTWGVRPDLIYVDAGHEEYCAQYDLTTYYQVLRPGGVIFGDDWSYPGVRSGVRKGCAMLDVEYQRFGGHWVVSKPC